jgi:hypothetical protein
MDSCKWIRHENGYICEVCSFKTKLENAYRVCKTPPSLLTKIGNFIPAFTNHILAGSPKCSEDEIQGRLKICQGCPLYVGNICSHDSCGCNIKDSQTFFNKLYWADQKCPLDKWDVVTPSG